MLESAGAIALKISCAGSSAAGAATVATAATDVLDVVACGAVDVGREATVQAIGGPDLNHQAGGHSLMNQAKEILHHSPEGLIKAAAEVAAESAGMAEESSSFLPFLRATAYEGVLGVATSAAEPATTMSAIVADAHVTELMELENQKLGMGEESLDVAEAEGEESEEQLVCKAVLSPVAGAVAGAASGRAVASETGSERDLQTSAADAQLTGCPLEEDGPAACGHGACSSSARYDTSASVNTAGTSSTTKPGQCLEDEEVVPLEKEDVKSSWYISVPRLNKVLPPVVLQAIEAVSEFSCRSRGCNPLASRGTGSSGSGSRRKPVKKEAKMSSSPEPEAFEPGASAACSRSSSDSSDEVVWV
mmetsp:Transcript_111387/g.197360  ORF Transcript_111387/g.197360 Transcript_111387/m.197360 type:complete len:362 (-) Transcript_111387:131-1216(-)